MHPVLWFIKEENADSVEEQGSCQKTTVEG